MHQLRSSLLYHGTDPAVDLYSVSPLDSDSAPLLKRCEGHLAGRPVPGELLLSGGGAAQQARGGGQVCSVHVTLAVPVFPALKLFADHP